MHVNLHLVRLVVAFWLVGVGAAWADPARQRPMVAPPVSPEIAADGRVTFRCRAPQAREVKVSGQFGATEVMQRKADDVWEVTAGPVPAGVHEYRFVVDGMALPDLLNPAIKPQRQPSTSILHIPSVPPAWWDLQEVPHGLVSTLDYQSSVLKKWRKVVVYSPPGYRSDAAPLPVLYLCHGFSDNEGAWSAHGKAHYILDNLLAAGKVKPMLVVMPDAHALPPGTGWKDEYGRDNSAAFCKELVTDLVPLVERGWHVVRSPEGRAFAGLSMGGRHALTVALQSPDQFAWIGAFSAAAPEPDLSAAADASVLNARLKLFWIGCGKKDFLLQRNEEFVAILKGKGVKHEFALTDGDHVWPVWRGYLVDFAPRLFR